MNNANPYSAEAVSHSAPRLSQRDAWLCDRMDADNEWERGQQPGAPERYGNGPQVAQSFEFDIHDCSVSEVNR